MKPQLFIGSKPRQEKMLPIQNIEYLINKPAGGLWTSTYDSETGSEWVQASYDMGIYNPSLEKWIITPSEDVNLFIIDSYQDFQKMIDQYSEQTNTSLRVYNFEEMAKEYDGIHLTKKGQKKTRLTFPYNLYGWDCESTIWFRWKFTKVEKFKGDYQSWMQDIT